MLFFLHRTFHLIPLGIQTDQLLKYTLYIWNIYLGFKRVMERKDDDFAAHPREKRKKDDIVVQS